MRTHTNEVSGVDPEETSGITSFEVCVSGHV